MFGVLMVDETGAGTSMLINNLVGDECVPVGHIMTLKLLQFPNMQCIWREFMLPCTTPLGWVIPAAIKMLRTLVKWYFLSIPQDRTEMEVDSISSHIC